MTPLKKINARERVERQKRFIQLRAEFKKTHPCEKWVRLIAQLEGISESMVYDVISGRR
jgi:hypothetical protein